MDRQGTSLLVDLVDAMLLRRSFPAPHERRAVRAQRGVSQAALARAVGVSRSTVTRWEQGARLPRDNDKLRRYHHVLRVLTLYPASLKGFEGDWGDWDELVTFSDGGELT